MQSHRGRHYGDRGGDINVKIGFSNDPNKMCFIA